MRPAEELRYLILGAQREGARAYAAALAPTGLTPAQ
ncbi:MarR family transcriptional regulator, partial [Clavibacter michiganensis subsp. insidiosus]